MPLSGQDCSPAWGGNPYPISGNVCCDLNYAYKASGKKLQTTDLVLNFNDGKTEAAQRGKIIGPKLRAMR